MTNISFNPKTTPMALVLVGGAVLLSLIYANAFGHIDSLFTVIFGIIGICILISGAYLFAWATKLAKIWNFS